MGAVVDGAGLLLLAGGEAEGVDGEDGDLFGLVGEAELGDERLIEQVAAAIGTSSPTTEELFRTLVRVRLAAARGRKLLDQKRSANAPARE